MNKGIAVVVMGVLLCLLMLVMKQRGQAPSSLGAVDGTVNLVTTVAKPVVYDAVTNSDERTEHHGELHIPSLPERRLLPINERIRFLEKHGCLPDNTDVIEYQLAEKTSWWGIRLDPKKFWSDKVVWFDRISERDARRRGRGWPPIPYDDPSVADRSDVDHQPDGHGAEGPTVRYVSSERERVFWINFIKKHPHPPADITHWQQIQADAWLGNKNIIENDPAFAVRLRMKTEYLDRMIETDRREANDFGYPTECLTPDAYRWAHIMQKRQDYEAIRVSGQQTDNVTLSNFFRRVYVNRKYITEPLSAEDVQAANAWKVAYLRRLLQEKTDESYINAYMQAWNLSSNDVFCNPLMAQ
jgi:hypothetical protein